MIECKVCSTSFKPRRVTQVYCSTWCRSKSNRDRAALRDPGYFKNWYEENKERLKPIRKDYEVLYSNQYPERRLYSTCKTRADKQNIPFDINVEDIVISEMCPVLKKPFKRCTPYAPSIDRIDPSKGYTKGNIQVISKLANVMKNNASPEDLRSFAHWVLKTYPS